MGRIMTAFLFVTATVSASFALSVERIVYTTADGSRFFWGTTAEGGLFVASEEQPDDLYLLMPDCAVTNLTLGTGSWGYENEGWQISFGNRLILYFPGQTPIMSPYDCQLLR